MIPPRWWKAIRDLGDAPLRTFLAVVAMAAGTFGIGASLSRYAILHRELDATYAATRPASAILHLPGANDAVVEMATNVDGVAAAEQRRVISARIQVGEDEWAPLVLFVIRDFEDLRIDRFYRDEGAWPPRADEVLIERSSISVARAAVGDDVVMRNAAGDERTLRFAGTVHAPGLAPGWMDHVVAGFVSGDSIARTAGEGAQLRIVVDEALNERRIRAVADRVKGALESAGIDVRRVEVPAPGRHPHADQMDTFLFLLGAFGALTVVLSAVLTASLIHTLMAEQVRQVGIMKAIGASDRQVAALYLAEVAILATAALALGTPLGVGAGRAYARFSAGILNATITDDAVPLWVFALLAVIGVGVPLLVSAIPVLRAARIPVHQAFDNGLSNRGFGARPFDRFLARTRFLSRPTMLTLRATFHKPGRLLLAAGMLGAGGAAFIAALNVGAAWDRALDADARARRYDLDVRFATSEPIPGIEKIVHSVPGIERAEYWPDSGASLVGPDGSSDAPVSVFAPPPGTTLLRLPLLAGRWLRSDDTSAVVVNQTLLSRYPFLAIGKPITLRIGRTVAQWQIVGVVEEMGPHLAVYAPSAQVRAASGARADLTRGARVVTSEHDARSQLQVSRKLERALRDAGIGVAVMQSLADRRQAVADHLVIIQNALAAASTLVVLVAGLALSSTLSLSVLERRREFGVLGAIGATPATISRTVATEALVIGILGWLAAIVFAIPATVALNRMAGQMFRKSGLPFYMSPGAVASCLLFILMVSAVCSFYPAWRSARMPVREALAYE